MFEYKVNAKSVATIVTTAAILALGSPAAAEYDWQYPMEEGEGYGASICNVGDVNRDGYPDFLISAPKNSTAGAMAGAVYLRSGTNGDLLWSRYGEAPGDRFGSSCAAYRDGQLEYIAIGAPRNDDRGDDAGKVYLFWNFDYDNLEFESSRTKSGRKAGDQFGHTVALANVGGDAGPDLIVGAPRNDKKGKDAGMVEVYSVEEGRRLWRRYGKSEKERFGHAVAALEPDANATYSTFAVSAPWNSDKKKKAGKVLVFKGGSFRLQHEIKGKRKSDKFGYSVTSIGDADGDGSGDLACGAPWYDARGKKNAGRVEAFSGRTGRRMWRRDGRQTQERFGHVIVPAPDTDGDGSPDCMIGAPRNDGNGRRDRGRVEVVSGDGQVAYSFTGQDAGIRLGSAMATGIIGSDRLFLFGLPRSEQVEPDGGWIETEFWGLPGGPQAMQVPEDDRSLEGLVDLMIAIGHVGDDLSDDAEAEGHPCDLDDDGDVDTDDVLTFLDLD